MISDADGYIHVLVHRWFPDAKLGDAIQGIRLLLYASPTKGSHQTNDDYSPQNENGPQQVVIRLPLLRNNKVIK